MNDSNTPYSKNRKITFPVRICTPVLEKAAFPMRNRSQRTKEGIKAAFQAEIRTPVSEKTGKTNPNRLLFMNGGRAKTTTNRTRRRKQPIYSIGTASKYCATPVAFAEPADSPDCIAPSKISAAAANSTVSSIKSPLFGANSPFDKP